MQLLPVLAVGEERVQETVPELQEQPGTGHENHPEGTGVLDGPRTQTTRTSGPPAACLATCHQLVFIFEVFYLRWSEAIIQIIFEAIVD